MNEIIKINKNMYLKKITYSDQNEHGIKIIKYENVTPWYKLFKTNYHIKSYFNIHLYKDSIHIIYYPNNYVGHVNINIKDILTIDIFNNNNILTKKIINNNYNINNITTRDILNIILSSERELLLENKDSLYKYLKDDIKKLSLSRIK